MTKDLHLQNNWTNLTIHTIGQQLDRAEGKIDNVTTGIAMVKEEVDSLTTQTEFPTPINNQPETEIISKRYTIGQQLDRAEVKLLLYYSFSLGVYSP